MSPRPRAVRPPLLQWLRYQLGGRLPSRYDEWVFADLTGRTWRLRVTARIVIAAVVPAVLLVIFLPGLLEIRIYTALIVLLGPTFFAATYGDELRARRLRQHGLLPPMGPDPD